MISASDLMAPGDYPYLSVRRIENPNRFWALPILGAVIKGIILIPVAIWLYILALVATAVIVINSFIVAFTGQYWETAYTLVLGLLRLELKVGFFLAGLTDRYPGFSLDIPSDELFSLDMPMPSSPSRGFAVPILGGIVRGVMLIPYSIWTAAVGYGTYLAVIVASFAVLFGGTYPISLFELVRDATRLSFSGYCYLLGFSDSYPSFSISMNNAVIKWLFIGLGFLAFFGNILQNLANAGTRR